MGPREGPHMAMLARGDGSGFTPSQGCDAPRSSEELGICGETMVPPWGASRGGDPGSRLCPGPGCRGGSSGGFCHLSTRAGK